MIEAVRGVSRPDRSTEAPSVLVAADGWKVRQLGRGGQPTRFTIRGVEIQGGQAHAAHTDHR